MKLFLLVLLVSLTATELRSQNCKILEGSKFFHSIKFGGQIPLDMTTVCAKGSIVNGDYLLKYDSLSQGCKKKYSDMFRFYTSTFSDLTIRTNKKGEMYFANLWSVLDLVEPVKTTDISFPEKFTKIYHKLTSLFGKETRRKDEKDPVLIEAFGASSVLTWECNDIELELRITYGSSIKALNVLSLYIMDRKFDTVEELETL